MLGSVTEQEERELLTGKLSPACSDAGCGASGGGVLGWIARTTVACQELASRPAVRTILLILTW